jgi:hypothetical protein
MTAKPDKVRSMVGEYILWNTTAATALSGRQHSVAAGRPHPMTAGGSGRIPV